MQFILLAAGGGSSGASFAQLIARTLPQYRTEVIALGIVILCYLCGVRLLKKITR